MRSWAKKPSFRLGNKEPMSGLNPDAMNEEKLCGIPQRTGQRKKRDGIPRNETKKEAG